MYELEIYLSNKDTLFVRVDEVGLEFFRESLDDDTFPDFIELNNYEHDQTLGIHRKRVTSYSYKEDD